MSNPQGKVNESEKLLSSAGNKQKTGKNTKCIIGSVIALALIGTGVFLAVHFMGGKSDDGGDGWKLSETCLNEGAAEKTFDDSNTATWIEDVQSNGKYWFALNGNKNFTKTLSVYNTDKDGGLVREILMTDNTTYLTTKDSKLTVSDDYVVMDLHAFPYQLPKKDNVSFSLDISGDPKDWGNAT